MRRTSVTDAKQTEFYCQASITNLGIFEVVKQKVTNPGTKKAGFAFMAAALTSETLLQKFILDT